MGSRNWVPEVVFTRDLRPVPTWAFAARRRQTLCLSLSGWADFKEVWLNRLRIQGTRLSPRDRYAGAQSIQEKKFAPPHSGNHTGDLRERPADAHRFMPRGGQPTSFSRCGVADGAIVASCGSESKLEGVCSLLGHRHLGEVLNEHVSKLPATGICNSPGTLRGANGSALSTARL